MKSLLPMLPVSRFRERFDDKLAQRVYVAAISTKVIVARATALIGCVERLLQGEP